MAYLGWFDGELKPKAWFDAELDPAAWWDTELVNTEDAPPASGGAVLKYWTGSAWTAKPLKFWTGAAWSSAGTLRYWDGTQWVPTAIANGIETEAGDLLATEAGDYITQE